MLLQDKVVIVTGAAQGIGRAHAEALHREGAAVVLADIQGEAAEAEAGKIVAAGGKAIGVRVDISSAAETAAMARATVDAFGRIDGLVNNAAIYAGYVHHTLVDLPPDYWQRFVDVNLTGVLLGAQAVAPQMIEQGSGVIVNQSSAGADQPRNQYSVTKLGVQGLTLGLARSLGPQGVRVNCLAPGVTDTEATRGHYSAEQLTAMVEQRTLLRKMAQPEDVADVLVWLVSDLARIVTGQIVHVDSGYVAHPA